MVRTLARAAALTALLLASPGRASAQTVQEEERLLSLGAYLADECSTCHKAGGEQGIPVISGQDPDHFIAALKDYRDDRRINSVMASVARSLSDNEMRALAAHFRSQGQVEGGRDSHPHNRIPRKKSPKDLESSP